MCVDLRPAWLIHRLELLVSARQVYAADGLARMTHDVEGRHSDAVGG